MNHYRSGSRSSRGQRPYRRGPHQVDKWSRKYKRNKAIRASEVRVIDPEGENLGVMPIAEAMRKAQAEELDLIELVPQAKPPVCRIMDWQKFKYEQEQKEKEQRKKQKSNQQKEIVFKSTIDTGDFNRKMSRIKEFLAEGRPVKVTLLKRRRQHPDMYQKFKEELLTKLKECSNIVSTQGSKHRAVFNVVQQNSGA